MSPGEARCSVCLSVEADSAPMHCGHRLCAECVSALTKLAGGADVITPPCCGTPGPAPALPPAPTPEGLPLCGHCEHGEGARDCLTCGLALCTPCLESHKRPAYQHHALGEPGSLAKRRKTQAMRMCGAHGEELKLFCTTCDRLACLVCVKGQHEGHACPPVAEAAQAAPKPEKLAISMDEAQAELSRIDGLLAEAQTKVVEGAAATKEAYLDAATAYAQRIEEDTAAKLQSIGRQRAALVAVQRRVAQGQALAAEEGDAVERLWLVSYVKDLARTITRSLVSVPTPLTADPAALQKAFPPPPKGAETVHKLSLKKLDRLVHDAFEFTPDTPDSVFSNENQRVASTRVVTAAARDGYTSGVHRWAIRMGGSPLNQMLGVVPAGTPLVGNIHGKHGFFLNVGTGRIVAQPQPGVPAPHTFVYCAPLASGASVGVKLDMELRTLSFTVEGKDAGIACRSLPAGPLYPAVALLGSGVQWAQYVDDAALPYTLLGQTPLQTPKAEDDPVVKAEPSPEP